ncbi:hypothetical protein EV199_1188 [Pseudobacter ginsenosidimutans]|uniref:Transmembrane protein n=1 Tax=Pseudobacter ginsenosidimutans TaxID=661488 RepID=A0A4Q7N1S1_9BACT|nr:hypothetical protein EV199_1188 [Pseudobacter ginsenosidimutans]
MGTQQVQPFSLHHLNEKMELRNEKVLWNSEQTGLFTFISIPFLLLLLVPNAVKFPPQNCSTIIVLRKRDMS